VTGGLNDRAMFRLPTPLGPINPSGQGLKGVPSRRYGAPFLFDSLSFIAPSASGAHLPSGAKVRAERSEVELSRIRQAAFDIREKFPAARAMAKIIKRESSGSLP
jgi:hypothetical protein